MARQIVMEEFHLTMLAPRGLPEAEYRSIRRTLDGKRFRVRLASAARRVCRRFAGLRQISVRLSR